MASNLVFDFRHHYVVGERRASEPSAYQFDQGHLAEIYVPENATSWEIHYAFGDFPLSEGYNVDDVEAADDGGYVITAHVPNDLFERSGELRVYLMAVEEESIITTYEGYVFIKNRNQPDDYVDDDPDNHATHLLEEAEAAAATAVEKAAETEAIATLSQSYAKGGTGTRTGEDTDNAKYYMERAATLSNADLVYAVYPTETAQGNPATFDDGAESIPVKDLKVSIVPNQDLHGYDKPWAGGAGKNLLPMTVAGIKAVNTSGTWSGNAYTHNGVTFALNTDDGGNIIGVKVSGTASANAYLEIHVTTPSEGQIISGCPSGGSQSTYNLGFTTVGYPAYVDTGSGYSLNYPLRGVSTKASIYVYSGYNASNLLFYPMLELGSTVTTFEPYSNLCPITGMTEVGVERTGKNLLDFNVQSKTSSGVTFTVNKLDGKLLSISTSGTATANTTMTISMSGAEFKKMLGVSEGRTNFILSGCPSGGSATSFYFRVARTVPSWQVYATNMGGDTALDVSQILDSYTVGVIIGVDSGTNMDGKVFYPMIRSTSDTDQTYEPYNAQTVTTDLGRTVYGGTLDVTTGVLTVDMASVDLGTLNDWGYNSTYSLFTATISNSASVTSTGLRNVICDRYPTYYTGSAINLSNIPDKSIVMNTSAMSQNNKIVIIKDSTYTDAATFKTAMSGAQLVYELATPQAYTLTPQELLSVLGTNHISTDAESVEVEYRADIQLYIENLTKPEEDDLIANQAIESGTFFMIGNRLFLSTASIANGAAITPGTNATELSLSEALNTLNA